MALEDLKAQWEQAPTWQKIVVLTIFPALVGFAIYYYGISPLLKEREELINRREHVKVQVEQLKKLAQRPQILDELRRELEKLLEQERRVKEEFERKVGELPTSDRIDIILGKLNSHLFKRGLTVLRVSLSEPVTKTFNLEKTGDKLRVVEAKQGLSVKVVEVEMVVEGSARQVIGFLKDLRSSKVISYPKSLTMDRGKSDKLRSVITIVLVLRGE